MTPAATLAHDPGSPAALAPMLYKVSDAVRVLRLSRSEIYEQIKAGRINTVHQGRATFITAEALDEYVKLLKQEAEAER